MAERRHGVGVVRRLASLVDSVYPLSLSPDLSQNVPIWVGRAEMDTWLPGGRGRGAGRQQLSESMGRREPAEAHACLEASQLAPSGPCKEAKRGMR